MEPTHITSYGCEYRWQEPVLSWWHPFVLSVISNSPFHVVLFVFALHLPPFCVFCSSSFCLKWLVYAHYDPFAVAGVCNDHGKTYALYAITVHRRNVNSEEMWKTYRRYSDFHDFHMRITEQVVRFLKFVYCILFRDSMFDSKWLWVMLRYDQS